MKNPALSSDAITADPACRIEVFVQRGFNAAELTGVTGTIMTANDIVGAERFSCRITSDMPGLVKGNAQVLVRAEPAIEGYGFADVMIVLGGKHIDRNGWIRRVRAMQRQKRPVVLLSDAATAFIRSADRRRGHVTTHWRDSALLKEQGYYPTLTTRLAEQSEGITTAAGAGPLRSWSLG